MKILVNRKIKRLFLYVLLAVAIFTVASILMICLGLKNIALYVAIAAVLMVLIICAVLYWYFRDQSKTMNEAIEQIREYISGNQNARIECDDEGDLYRLFHEVNSLVTILNAHAENEGRAKAFMKDTISDISHQLKTPLASLKMSYELADSPELTAEEHAEFTRKEREEVSRMESLLGVFSQLTRLESGMIQIRPENSSLKKTISEAVGSIYMKAFEKGIDISLEEFPDVMIPHDPRWTAEVILNILDNAVKYSPSGTAVSIRVSALASYMMVEISDQGIGIPASDIQNIFKRFYRGSAPEVKSADGSGVGLYLARRILEEQGGTICVKTGTDGGSTFALTLPK